jgi:PAS domain-containing protein
MGQMAFHLMIALFLTLFMAAVAQSLVYTLLIAVVVCAAYLGQRLQTPEGFEVVKPSDFLDLPFILIVGMHAGTLVKESLKEHSEIFSLSTAKRLLKEELKKSARRIDELMEDTEAVFDALPLPVIVMDEFCILHAFNTQAESVFKFSRRKVLGREMKEVPLLVPLRKGFAEGLLGGKRPEVMEFKDYDGNPRQMLLGLVRTRDKKGSTSGVLGFLTAVNDVDDPGETLAVIYMPKPAAITPPAEPEPEPAPEEEDGPKKSGPGPAAPPPAASSSEMSMPL